MSIRFSRHKRKNNSRTTITAQEYAPAIIPMPARPSKAKKPLIFLPGNRVMTQDPTLPRIVGQVGVRGDRQVTALDIALGRSRNGSGTHDPTLLTEYFAPNDNPSPSKHFLKREKQWLSWKNNVLPSLITPYMNLLRETSSLRKESRVDVNLEACTHCASTRQLTVVLVRFHKLETVTFSICSCETAAIQLVRSGLFPCSPLHPTLAVDIRVLDFVRRLFLRIAPNYTAWCAAVVDFLGAQGYKLPGDDPLRRRFTNCLQWFIHLHDLTNAYVDQELHTQRRELIPDMTLTPPSKSPSQHCKDEISSSESEGEGIETSDDEGSSIDSDGGEASDSKSGGSNRKRVRDEKEEEEESERDADEEESELERPSEFLRDACPACFGGQQTESVIVVLDACFTQKHNRNASKGGRDPPRVHPGSIFLPEKYVERWHSFVEEARSKTSSERSNKRAKHSDKDYNQEEDDYREPGLQVPKSILDGCLSSFTAADETRIKGSTTFFDVTGQMTLLCRHDRPLWSVNMKTAGEGQHYTLALLAKLFKHLPNSVKVKLLYDIGCQLHRSCMKWGLLKPYLTRMTFAISIFHAFGHQWPCQIVYHPRKCIGYGLTDGEGAERLWHGISKLIAYGRVAGYHMRVYNLDSQFKFNNEDSLFKLASWIRRKHLACKLKHQEAMAVLQSCGLSIDELREHWKAQVAAQTKPLPRQHKNKGKSAVEEILRLRKIRDTIGEKMARLQEGIIDESTTNWERATAELEYQAAKENMQKIKVQLQRKERALGANGGQALRHLINSPYLTLKMNARALLIRIRERLRSTKFEFDRLERSYRKHRSEQRLSDHIKMTAKRREPATNALARKYNKIVDEMVGLILRRKAPRNATAPAKIDLSTLFELDVDDDIWLDIGLDYDDDPSITPPAWLSDENVRRGIRAMLDKDRCDEEREMLRSERCAIQEWFSEEWKVIESAMGTTEGGLLYQMQVRRERLCHLYSTWERALRDLPTTERLPDWGLTVDEVGRYAQEHVVGAGVAVTEDVVYDVEYEEEADDLLMEYLDSVNVATSYKERKVDSDM